MQEDETELPLEEWCNLYFVPYANEENYISK